LLSLCYREALFIYMDEEELWELINDNRHRISLGVRPCILIPYLRQARVLTEMDEDEIVSCHNLTNRCMRTSYMLDLLRTQGRNGAVALLESLMIHYPTLYTQVTGRKPSTEPSRFSGLIKYSELTEYLVRAVTGMQKELQEARLEAGRMSTRCASLESEIRQIMEQEEKSRSFQAENERMRRHFCALQRDVTKLKDEKCDLYMRYTAAMEEKSAMSKRNSFQIYSLKIGACVLTSVYFLFCLFQARQEILAQDLAEAIDSQVELAEQLRCYREENEQLLREKQGVSVSIIIDQDQQSIYDVNVILLNLLLKDSDVLFNKPCPHWCLCVQLLDQKECLSLQVQQLTVDCNMYQQKSTMIQNQMRELQAERDQYLYCFRISSLTSLSRTSAPPFLMRSRAKAIRISGRVLSISFQGDTLLNQLTVVGGNKTGVFVHQVTEGSAAHTVGISPGAQIVEVKYEQNQKALRMVMEDSTLEEAVWALSQVKGLCHLSLRPKQDGMYYAVLLQQLQDNESSSGDSFYVRVNMSLHAGPSDTLAVSCNDILHVTNTRPTGTEDLWHASQVHPCQLLDLQSGTKLCNPHALHPGHPALPTCVQTRPIAPHCAGTHPGQEAGRLAGLSALRAW
uniref:Caspase recruitment domain family, member 14 n=1 Tax=Mastacembelus armatus TaxID=205130 RepID=A0A7N8YR57_9TELE